MNENSMDDPFRTASQAAREQLDRYMAERFAEYEKSWLEAMRVPTPQLFDRESLKAMTRFTAIPPSPFVTLFTNEALFSRDWMKWPEVAAFGWVREVLEQTKGWLKNHPPEEELNQPEEKEECRIVTLAQHRAMENLIARLNVDPDERFHLDPRVYEQLVAALLEKEGFEVMLTPQTRDGGKDIIAVHKSFAGEIMIAVECKRYAPHHKVGAPVVRQLLGAIASPFSRGLLVTTSGFSRDAQKVADTETHRLTIRDGKAFMAWMRQLTSP